MTVNITLPGRISPRAAAAAAAAAEAGEEGAGKVAAAAAAPVEELLLPDEVSADRIDLSARIAAADDTEMVSPVTA